MNTIDISTEEKKKEVYDLFASFRKKGDIHIYFGISDNSDGCEYIRKIAEEIGFDLNSYKKKKHPRYCKNCGKEITSKSAKEFCSSSCAATYHNFRRDKSIYNKLSETLKKKYAQEHPKTEKIKKEETQQKQRRKKKACKILVCKCCGKTFESKRSDIKFCSTDCSQKYRNDVYLNKWLNGEIKNKPTTDVSQNIRRFLYKKADYKCEKCGFEGYNKVTGNTILQIHHIDGDSGNNNIDNLEILCPNCHAMTENFMALNKGKSTRKDRYKNIRPTPTI